MKIEDRIAKLEDARKAEQDQMDWLLSVEWSNDDGSATDAADHHARTIRVYDALIAKLKARP